MDFCRSDAASVETSGPKAASRGTDSFKMAGQRVRTGSSLEGRLPGQHLMEDDAQSEDVAPVIDTATPSLLG
jgi:hypothetical protein